jgi:hypothetical protein
MTQHVAGRILDTIASLLTTAGKTVLREPFVQITDDNLPACIIRNIKDEVMEAVGFFPVEQTRLLTFEIFACDMASTSGLRSSVDALRYDVEVALLGSETAKKLNGLLTRGLSGGEAVIDVDSESLQKPVGGWSITFECVYGLRTNAPGQVEKE